MKRRYKPINGALAHMLMQKWPAWLRRELAIVHVRQAWQKLPLPLRQGAAPMEVRGRILIVGVDGAPRKTELSFQKPRILNFLSEHNLVFEDIKFRLVSADVLPRMAEGQGYDRHVADDSPVPEEEPLDETQKARLRAAMKLMASLNKEDEHD